MSSDRHNTMAWLIDDSFLNLRRSTRNILLSNTATNACGERSLAQHLHLHSCNSVHAKDALYEFSQGGPGPTRSRVKATVIIESCVHASLLGPPHQGLLD